MRARELPDAGPGETVGFHPVRKSYLLTILSLALALLGAAGVVFVSGWRAAEAEWALHGPLTAVPAFTGPALAGLLFALAGLTALLIAALNAGRAVEVRAHGLVLHGPGKGRAFGWPQVTRFRAEVARRYLLGLLFTGTRCRYTLSLANGTTLRLDHRYRDAELLGERIAAHVTPYQAKRAAQAFAAGQELVFGAVRAQRGRGLRLGRRDAAWGEIASAGLSEGWLRVGLNDGREIRVAAERIVNAGALVELLRDVLSRDRSRGPGQPL